MTNAKKWAINKWFKSIGTMLLGAVSIIAMGFILGVTCSAAYRLFMYGWNLIQ